MDYEIVAFQNVSWDLFLKDETDVGWLERETLTGAPKIFPLAYLAKSSVVCGSWILETQVFFHRERQRNFRSLVCLDCGRGGGLEEQSGAEPLVRKNSCSRDFELFECSDSGRIHF